MIRFVLDECVSGKLVRALREAEPMLDFVTVHEAGLEGCSDAQVVRWASVARRVVVTQDVRTMPAELWDLLGAGVSSPGMVIIHSGTPIRQVVDELTIIALGTDKDALDRLLTEIPL